MEKKEVIIKERFATKKEWKRMYRDYFKSLDGSGIIDDTVFIEMDKDDETITINIENIGSFADTLYLVLNIFNAYNKGQHFNMVSNSYVRVYDDKGAEMAYFDLAEDYHNMTGVVVGKLEKVNGAFQFIALGDGVRVKGLDELSKRVNQY